MTDLPRDQRHNEERELQLWRAAFLSTTGDLVDDLVDEDDLEEVARLAEALNDHNPDDDDCGAVAPDDPDLEM